MRVLSPPPISSCQLTPPPAPIYLHTPPPSTHTAPQSNGIKVIWSDTLCNSQSFSFPLFLLSVGLSFTFFFSLPVVPPPPTTHTSLFLITYAQRQRHWTNAHTGNKCRSTLSLIFPLHTYMLVCIQYWIVHWGSLGLLVGRTRGCKAALSSSH